MQRRDFIKLAAAGSALPLISSRSYAAEPTQDWRTFRLTYQIDLPTENTPASLWLPLPETASDGWQQARKVVSVGVADSNRVIADKDAGASYYNAFWKDGKQRQLEVSCVARSVDRSVTINALAANVKATPPRAVQAFLNPSQHIPVDGIVLDTAREATKGAHTPLEKARAIYDWVVDNSFREPKTPGCGRGDIKFMLETGNLGGKCADISSLFVGLARASGIPARDVFGIRVADSKQFKSLGKTGDVTRAQHCRAEFYLAGHGWVPVDPADVRKAVLEEQLALNDPKIVALREKLFGYWEMNWMAFNHARDFSLMPKATSNPINFLMYPYAELAGVPREQLVPDQFVYRIKAEELAA
jgi:transglutaminase-like putative cysteine protease